MKLLILFTVVACLQVSAHGFGQTVTLSLNNAPLEKVFKEIKKQTGYSFVYTRVQLKNTLPVTILIKNSELKEALELCFRNQPLSFLIEDRYIVVQNKNATTQPASSVPATVDITGKVVNENGEALAGVTVSAKKSNKATSTNERGEFNLKDIDENDVLIITSVGYYKEEIEVDKQSFFLINLRVAVGTLDETIVMAYGKTSRRLNTGNISKVSSEEIGNQPVSNLLATLHGRVPGLIVTQSTGVTGGRFTIQIRGRNSIAQGSEPLFIIDGVPFAANNNNTNQLTSALASYSGQGLSPLNSLNPQDIESIEILKDADATSIFGSRGANGVILITTKKGFSGKTKFSVNLNTGFSKVTRTMEMMNTEQYVTMRKEAFNNDGYIPDIFSAPDLVAWDTTRYNDFKKMFIGGVANTIDAQASVSGGTANTQFLIRGAYRFESTVFPGDLSDKKSSVHFNLTHNSADKKFNLAFSANYSSDKNTLPLTDYTAFLVLPPNLPSLYDSSGKLNWEMGGVSFDNPMAYIHQKYNVTTDNLISNFQAGYQIIKSLTGKVSLGYNTTLIDEAGAFPKTSQNPQNSPTGTALFGINRFKSWIIEPQLEYSKKINKGKFTFLLGGALQQIMNYRSAIQASGYTSDALLGSLIGATSTTVTDGYSQYRYQAIFGRINYNWKDKYIINLTGRRDGSSRFGPDKQFANFFAGGASWLFSNEGFFKRSSLFLSYGKLRVSYGTTGNDQIGDYQYLDTWRPLSNRYQGPSLIPSRLLNPDYSWEINRKLEFAADFGFMKDRILLSTVYYLNRSTNQLVNYRLPGQTGFTSIIKNFPAIVQNKGFESSIVYKIISNSVLKWTLSANISIPKNELVSFPGLSSSSYAKIYIEGKPLNFVYGYRLLGVDPSTGVYQFEDVNRDGFMSSDDYASTYNLDPKYFGGIGNTLEYKGWELNFFFEFKKQIGLNYNNYPIYNFTPGAMNNLPVVFLDRWQKPGDNSFIQQFTQTFTPAYDGQYYFSNSDGRFSDASYARLKTASLSYNFSERLLKKLRLANFRIYVLGQNLFTLTSYEGSDPETQNLFVLPPLRTITAGIQLTF